MSLLPIPNEVIKEIKRKIVIRPVKKYRKVRTLSSDWFRKVADEYTPPLSKSEVEEFRKNPWRFGIKVIDGIRNVNFLALILRGAVRAAKNKTLAWIAALYILHSAVDNNHLKYDRIFDFERPLGVRVPKEFKLIIPVPSTWNFYEFGREIRVRKRDVFLTILSIAQELEGEEFSSSSSFINFFLEGYEELRTELNLAKVDPPNAFLKLRDIITHPEKYLRNEEVEEIKEELDRWL